MRLLLLIISMSFVLPTTFSKIFGGSDDYNLGTSEPESFLTINGNLLIKKILSA